MLFLHHFVYGSHNKVLKCKISAHGQSHNVGTACRTLLRANARFSSLPLHPGLPRHSSLHHCHSCNLVVSCAQISIAWGFVFPAVFCPFPKGGRASKRAIVSMTHAFASCIPLSLHRQVHDLEVPARQLFTSSRTAPPFALADFNTL